MHILLMPFIILFSGLPIFVFNMDRFVQSLISS